MDYCITFRLSAQQIIPRNKGKQKPSSQNPVSAFLQSFFYLLLLLIFSVFSSNTTDLQLLQESGLPPESSHKKLSLLSGQFYLFLPFLNQRCLPSPCWNSLHRLPLPEEFLLLFPFSLPSVLLCCFVTLYYHCAVFCCELHSLWYRLPVS